MRKWKMFLGAVLLLGWISPCFAGNPQNMEQENAQLRRRLERLENAIEELRKAAVARNGPASLSQAAPAASPGEDAKNLKEENAQLKQRVEKLESALASLGNKETNKPPSRRPNRRTRRPPQSHSPPVCRLSQRT
jgi:DNA repair exonuclease SbcCD ATPase subunit